MDKDEFEKVLYRLAWPENETKLEPSPMYERFTDRARKVMQLAQQECDRLNHEYVGTEHILVGLLKEGSGVAANVLKNLDMDLHKIRSEIDKIVQPAPEEARSNLAKKPITPRGKKVLEYAIEEARTLNHNYVGTEHLLLGLLRVEEGIACQVLTNLGLNIEDVKEEVMNLLGHGKEERPEKEWKMTVAIDAPKMVLAEIERIVTFETDPAKAVEEIKKLFKKNGE